MEIGIIGGGIMGLCAAWRLTKSGHAITLFEQSTIPNPTCSSYDDHRLIRLPYGNMEGYMDMVPDAYRAWDEVWTDLGTSYYAETGTLILGKTETGWAAASFEMLKKKHYAFTRLSKAMLSEAYPFLTVNDIELAIYLNSGGILKANCILKALKTFLLTSDLLSSDVKICEHHLVTELDPQSGTVVVNATEYKFDACIVTAGPWVTSLFPHLANLVTPSRQPAVYIDFDKNNDCNKQNTIGLQACPMILDIDHASGFYLVPPVSDTRLKVGDHRFTLKGDPKSTNIATTDELHAILEATYQRIPSLKEKKITGSSAGYYTVSSDERFIAEQIYNSWILTGFSGHGFKFAPLIARHLASVIDGETTGANFISWISGS